MTATSTSPSAAARSNVRAGLGGCLAIALVIATLGLPANLSGVVAASLRLTGTQLTWVGDICFFGSAVSAYLLGSVAERVGRKRVLLCSTALIVIGQLVASLSQSVGVLGAAQALTGIGVGGLAGPSLAVVMRVIATGRQRAVNLSAYASALALGSVGSALIGGYTAEHTSYAWAFGRWPCWHW